MRTVRCGTCTRERDTNIKMPICKVCLKEMKPINTHRGNPNKTNLPISPVISIF